MAAQGALRPLHAAVVDSSPRERRRRRGRSSCCTRRPAPPRGGGEMRAVVDRRFSRWLHALRQLVLLHARRRRRAPRRRRRAAAAAPAHRRGGGVGGSAGGSLAAVANWPDDFEMKTRRPTTRCRCPRLRQAVAARQAAAAGWWARGTATAKLCAVPWGCSVATATARACRRRGRRGRRRARRGMRIVLVVLLLVRAAAPPIPARASKIPATPRRPAPPPSPLPALTTARPRLSDFPVQSRRTTCGRGTAAMPPATPCPPPALGATSTASAAPSGAREAGAWARLSTGDDGAARAGRSRHTRRPPRFRERGAANPALRSPPDLGRIKHTFCLYATAPRDF